MVGTTTAVVTGANSFIATEIVAQLLHKGYTVRATVRDVSDPAKTEHLDKLAQAFPGELTFHEAKLGVRGSFKEVIEGANYVYHCAANLFDGEYQKQSSVIEEYMTKDKKQKVIKEAINSQLDILHAVAANKDTVRSIVITSSMAAVKPLASIRMKPWSEDDWNALTDDQMEKNFYEYSKTLIEKKSFEIAEELGITLSSIAPSFVIGPVISDQLGFSPYLIKRSIEEQSCGADWLATAVDVRDVARAHILAAEKGGPGGRYLLARSHPMPPAEMVDSLREALPEYKIDEENVASHGHFNPNFHIFDTSKAQNELGLQFTDVQESLNDMVVSMMKKGMIHLEPKETDQMTDNQENSQAEAARA